jgi:putative transposase
VCEGFGAQLREFNGDTDHVHLLVHYPQRGPVPAGQHRQRRVLAAAASTVRRTHPPTPIGRAFLVTVVLRRVLRRRPLSTIKDYIEQQE